MTKEESIIRVDASFNTLAYIREQIINGCNLQDIDNHCKATMEACTKQLKLHNVVVPKGTLCDCVGECGSLDVTIDGCRWLGNKK